MDSVPPGGIKGCAGVHRLCCVGGHNDAARVIHQRGKNFGEFDWKEILCFVNEYSIENL